MADFEDPLKGWELYYWPGLGGRGIYVSLIFELVGAEYEYKLAQLSVEEAYKTIDSVRGEGEDMKALFYPIIKKGEFIMCQMPAIVLFLAELFGLEPTDKAERARYLQTIFMIEDCIVEAQRASHPIDITDDYENQKEEADRRLECLCKYTPGQSFRQQGRLFQHLFVVEAQLRRNGGEWLHGKTLTAADIFTATFMRAFSYSRPADYATMTSHELSELRRHRLRFESLPFYVLFAASARFPPAMINASFMA